MTHVTPAERVIARQNALETARYEARSVKTAALVGQRTMQGVIAAYVAGRDVTKSASDGILRGVDELTDSMVVAYLLGLRKMARSASLSLSANAEAVKVLRDQLLLSEEDLGKLRERFHADAIGVLTGMSNAVEKKIGAAMAEIVASGAHVAEGKRMLQAAFDAAGISPRNSFQLETIYRTQMQLAYGAAKWQGGDEPAVKAILWGYKYVTVGDDRVRLEHALLEGTTLPRDDDFWRENFPPNGWGCRCQAIELFNEREQVKAPDGPQEIDGQTITPGADKHFRFNPGILMDEVKRIAQRTEEDPIAKIKADMAKDPNREYAYLVDENGRVLTRAEGAADQVEIDPKVFYGKDTPAKLTHIHNHPTGGSFSGPDWARFSFHKVDRMRVLSGVDDTEYRLVKPEGYDHRDTAGKLMTPRALQEQWDALAEQFEREHPEWTPDETLDAINAEMAKHWGVRFERVGGKATEPKPAPDPQPEPVPPLPPITAAWNYTWSQWSRLKQQHGQLDNVDAAYQQWLDWVKNAVESGQPVSREVLEDVARFDWSHAALREYTRPQVIKDDTTWQHGFGAFQVANPGLTWDEQQAAYEQIIREAVAAGKPVPQDEIETFASLGRQWAADEIKRRRLPPQPDRVVDSDGKEIVADDGKKPAVHRDGTITLYTQLSSKAHNRLVRTSKVTANAGDVMMLTTMRPPDLGRPGGSCEVHLRPDQVKLINNEDGILTVTTKPEVFGEAWRKSASGAVARADEAMIRWDKKTSVIAAQISAHTAAHQGIINECQAALAESNRVGATPEQVAAAMAKLQELRDKLDRHWAENELLHAKASRIREETTAAIHRVLNIKKLSYDIPTVNLDSTQLMTIPPDRRRIAKEGINSFKSLVDDRAWGEDRPDIVVAMDQRPYTGRSMSSHYAHNDVAVIDSESGISTVAHELAHGLEAHNPEILRAAKAFREYRTQGEPLVKLKDIYPTSGYDDWEVCKKDRFLNAYAGKVYSHPALVNRSTEVISMGMQWMHTDPARFRREDPEYFDFMVRVLKGEVRNVGGWTGEVEGLSLDPQASGGNTTPAPAPENVGASKPTKNTTTLGERWFEYDHAALVAAISRGEDVSRFLYSSGDAPTDAEIAQARKDAAELTKLAKDERSPHKQLYRGLVTKDAYVVGQTVTLPGLAATATTQKLASVYADPQYGDGKPTIFHIEDSKGVRGHAFNETEVVLPPGASYRVTRVWEEDGVRHVTLYVTKAKP